MNTRYLLIGFVSFVICTMHVSALSQTPNQNELNKYCHTTLNGNSLSGATHFNGTLCAVDPTLTHPSIINPEDSLGYGFHVVGIPDNLSSNTPVWVHFAGAYGKPFSPEEGFNTQLWMGEIVNQGYLVFGLAVDNSFSLNSEHCNDSYEDGCVWKVREDVTTGSNFSDHVDSNWNNSVLGRQQKLVEYLRKKGLKLPHTLAAGRTWREVLAETMLSGHSQGAGTAFYIAKYQKVRGACAFGGPGDPADLVNPQYVDNKPVTDWIVEGAPVNPMEVFFGASLDKDRWAQEHKVRWKGYGLSSSDYKVVDTSKMTLTSIDGEDLSTNGIKAHGAILGAVEAASVRAECFKRDRTR